LDQPYVLDRAKCMSMLLQDGALPGHVRKVMENSVGD